ncbi:anaerobic ribonucleoside-triphosphate reductase activating protein [Parabacteroides sp. PF5-5]|uniref:anaerobic ribonucleoside-triphosphate reductase activating protein n=1 Tax=unclassified Parabacteroides TaxID=2649774 RepID=UPI0024748D43|nr:MULTISPECIES: anaerobic ribonucleoside-triphosphate reductase activating protein [unclassified Parabacteroides]MDH6306807.1 anaerobic ribonucleoside-triphosphate reductase activating protein [Parabacteroides sp. PH5-39]MDH6317693.1 anaerobic ribonucleoside-triphosphate reductase activating protein [Parabacteroides sp. PF5-13]MDH6321519.1 anaerobic ribonucleoside-triphosphate reductase activating protein [Parabacteroides sp. PH5-13]MDH6325204.1 anaerobic ribonucleoside-triphosphate reductase 
MLRFVNYDIVFQEVPGEVTLAINISNCPNRCKGCHSPYLMEDRGEALSEENLAVLLEKYGNAITCVCFMGGDAAPQEIDNLAAFLQRKNARLKTGWYSGKTKLSPDCRLKHFNYIKLGPYIEQLGGLNSSSTNQRFYHVVDGEMVDMTYHFHKGN